MKPYEESLDTKVKVSEEHHEVINKLIESLPKVLQNTVDVRVPNTKYPNLKGTVVEDDKGNLLYYQPYMPALISPFPIGLMSYGSANQRDGKSNPSE